MNGKAILAAIGLGGAFLFFSQRGKANLTVGGSTPTVLPVNDQNGAPILDGLGKQVVVWQSNPNGTGPLGGANNPVQTSYGRTAGDYLTTDPLPGVNVAGIPTDNLIPQQRLDALETAANAAYGLTSLQLKTLADPFLAGRDTSSSNSIAATNWYNAEVAYFQSRGVTVR